IILLVQTLAKAVAIKGLSKAEGAPYPSMRILSALAMVIAYFPILNVLGFYFTSFLFYLVFTFAFFADREEFIKRLHIRIAIPALFVGILYMLFALLLKVSTPSGLLF
ncbi:hypothetical protein LCGC14_2799170, partial [marine sediment metagenome]